MAIRLSPKVSERPVKGSRPLPLFIPGKQRGIRFGKQVKSTEVIFFSSQLSLMLEIGTTMSTALKAIGIQTKNPAFKEIIQAMNRDIEEGRQLSDAMKRHPKVFDSLFTSMVKSGETGGFLKSILDRIVVIQEKRQALITQLRSSITYPVVLCLLSIAVVIFVLVGILPKFAVFFEGKESVLPFTTRCLMSLSASLHHYWWAYVISVVGLAFSIKIWKETETGQAVIDRALISMPLVAGLSNKIYTCQLLSTLGHLMESRVPLLEALEVTRATIGNRYYRRFVDQIRDHVEKGGRFSQPFATYSYMLESVKQMVSTGEEIGNLPKVMLRLAEYYDIEVDQELKTFAAMVEPLALVFLGAVVGIIVSSIILPLFKLSMAIH